MSVAPSDDADVIVVGGGIAGLGLANALAAQDLSVLLLEKRRRPGGIHRGDSLLPSSTAWFARWGVLHAIREAGGVPIDRIEIHAGARELCRTPLVGVTSDAPYLVLPHARIEAALEASALASGRVRLLRQAKVTGLVRDGERVRGVRWESSEGGGEARARLVVACDGHRSLVREQLGIGVRARPYDHAYLGLEADKPAGYRDAMRVHFHRDGGCLLMPRTERIGIGLLVERGGGERWIKMSDQALREELVGRAPILADVAIHREGAHVYELVRAHAERYVAAGAVIIGDAAHCTNPTAGQGMTMALGDAGLLAELVGPALRGGDLERALAEYQAVQWSRNEALIRGSHRLAKVYALRGRGWHMLKTALVRGLAVPPGRWITAAVMRHFLAHGARVTEGLPALPAPRLIARAA